MFIFAADTHLKKCYTNSIPKVYWDSLYGLRYVLNLSRKYRAPLVLGGDIWDSTVVSSELLQRVVDLRRAFMDVPIYYINGNHDEVIPSWTSFLPDATELGQTPVTLPGGERLVGMSFRYPSADFSNIQQYLADTSDDADYLVCHQYIVHSDDSIIPSHVPLKLFSKFSRVLAGDIHDPSVIRGPDTTLWYAGTTTRTRHAATAGSCLLVDGGHLTHQTVPIRPVVRLSLDLPVAYVHLSDIYPTFKETLEPYKGTAPYLIVTSKNFQTAAVRNISQKLLSEGYPVHLILQRLPQVASVEFMDGEISGIASSLTYAEEAVKQLTSISEDARSILLDLVRDTEGGFVRLKAAFGMD